MAINKDNTNHQLTSAEHPNGPELVSKTVDDVSRIIRTEIELLEIKLKRVLEAHIDKIAGVLILLGALIFGSLFLLSGVVLLLHLWLAWWLSMLITGGLIVGAGILAQMTWSAAARKKRLIPPTMPVGRLASGLEQAQVGLQHPTAWN
jgi:Putative Actinobacterial Holin-X, holin superfamily III